MMMRVHHQALITMAGAELRMAGPNEKMAKAIIATQKKKSQRLINFWPSHQSGMTAALTCTPGFAEDQKPPHAACGFPQDLRDRGSD
jgi:hypothetical protein